MDADEIASTAIEHPNVVLVLQASPGLVPQLEDGGHCQLVRTEMNAHSRDSDMPTIWELRWRVLGHIVMAELQDSLKRGCRHRCGLRCLYARELRSRRTSQSV
jgi:hypothetical protein